MIMSVKVPSTNWQVRINELKSNTCKNLSIMREWWFLTVDSEGSATNDCKPQGTAKWTLDLCPEQWHVVDREKSTRRKALRHPSSIERKCNPLANNVEGIGRNRCSNPSEVCFRRTQDVASAQQKPSEPTNNVSWHRGGVSTNRVKWKPRYCTNPNVW